jgi:molybdopterin/thiamine biosynthesis adenylyltransferase
MDESAERNYELFRRQLGFYNPEEQPTDTVSIIGLGGIGSFAAFGIAKLGVPHITLVDFDHVETHNIPNQFHGYDQIGETKVRAMANNLFTFADHTGISEIEGAVGDELEGWDPKGVVISGVDSMSARHSIWEKGNLKYNTNVTHYIDARIAGQTVVIYSLDPADPDSIESYEKTLHTDGEAEPAPCTERGVIDVGLMVGALLTNMTRHALTGGEVASVTSLSLAFPPVTSGDWVL